MSKLRSSIIETCIKMNREGLNQGTSGNVSCRDGQNFLITPSGVPYEELDPQMIVLVTGEGEYEGPLKPSSEWRMHADIYKVRPDAGAVVHVHSPYATALSCHGHNIPAFHYMVAVAGGEDVRCADYATFGTQELSNNMITALIDRSACLLSNHGQIAFGDNLTKALWLANEIETLAKQYILAMALGEPAVLGSQEMWSIIEKFKTYGK
jgi:L-fuculose-phosphate aldolase